MHAQTSLLRNPIQKLIALDKKNIPSNLNISFDQLLNSTQFPVPSRSSNDFKHRAAKSASPEDDFKLFWEHINSLYFKTATESDFNQIDSLISQLHTTSEGKVTFPLLSIYSFNKVYSAFFNTLNIIRLNIQYYSSL